MISALLAGLGLSLSLIVAPGAQNVFLLKTGIVGRHAVPLALVCLASDVVLISAGVAGFGVVVAHAPWIVQAVKWAGVVFLGGYALMAGWRALRPSPEVIAVADPGSSPASPVAAADTAEAGSGTTATLTLPRTQVRPTGTLLPAVLTCLAITWLNPHTYLDTVLLLGSVSTGYDDARWMFGLGAIVGSAIWFAFLTVLARVAARWLRSPGSWRMLDAGIAVVMLVLAAGLAVS